MVFTVPFYFCFCNAGFDLIGIRTPFSSLTSYSVQPIVNLVIMMLIIAGGIGFLTWEDIKNRKWHFKNTGCKAR